MSYDALLNTFYFFKFMHLHICATLGYRLYMMIKVCAHDPSGWILAISPSISYCLWFLKIINMCFLYLQKYLVFLSLANFEANSSRAVNKVTFWTKNRIVYWYYDVITGIDCKTATYTHYLPIMAISEIMSNN